MILYIAMAYIIHATAKFYVYDFMDISMMGGLTAAYIFGIGAMGVVAFFVVQGVVWVKGAVGGGRVWRSRYDVPQWGFEQRGSGSSQGSEGKEHRGEMREW
jgi:hypothetical protein